MPSPRHKHYEAVVLWRLGGQGFFGNLAVNYKPGEVRQALGNAVLLVLSH